MSYKHLLQEISEYIPQGLNIKYCELVNEPNEPIHTHYVLILGLGRFLSYACSAQPKDECAICGLNSEIEELYNAEYDISLISFLETIEQGSNSMKILGIRESEVIKTCIFLDTGVNAQLNENDDRAYTEDCGDLGESTHEIAICTMFADDAVDTAA
jgi:hypothetical protein